MSSRRTAVLLFALLGVVTTVAVAAVDAADRAKPAVDRDVVEAINLACAAYGDCETLWRRAKCETGGTLNPRSFNRSSGASGLFQFLPSTWATTPYRVFSVWSPYANALAAGWMNTHGRGGEWACR